MIKEYKEKLNAYKKNEEIKQPKRESYYEYFDEKTREKVRLVWKNNINSVVVPSSKWEVGEIIRLQKFF